MWNAAMLSLIISFGLALALLVMFFTSMSNDKSIWLGKEKSGSWMRASSFWKSKIALSLIVFGSASLILLMYYLIQPFQYTIVEDNQIIQAIVVFPLGLAGSMLFLSMILFMINLLTLRWFIKERRGYTKVISLRKYVSPYDNRGDFEKLEDVLEKAFHNSKLEISLQKRNKVGRYIHGVVFDLPNEKMVMEIEKIAHVSSPNFRFILLPKKKAENITPKKVMRILDEMVFKNGDIELRKWREVIKDMRRKKPT